MSQNQNIEDLSNYTLAPFWTRVWTSLTIYDWDRIYITRRFSNDALKWCFENLGERKGRWDVWGPESTKYTYAVIICLKSSEDAMALRLAIPDTDYISSRRK